MLFYHNLAKKWINLFSFSVSDINIELWQRKMEVQSWATLFILNSRTSAGQFPKPGKTLTFFVYVFSLILDF